MTEDNEIFGENTNEKHEMITCTHCNKEVTHIDGTDYECPYCGMILNQENAGDAKKHMFQFKKDFFIGKKVLMFISISLFIIIAILSTYLVRFDNTIQELTSQVNDISDDYNKTKDDYDDLSNNYNTLERNYNNLASQHKSLKNDYESIKTEVENYKDQQATIDDLNTKLSDIHTQYDALLAARNSLQAQVDAKKAEQQRIAQEQEAQRIAQAQSNAISGTVYWVSGGEVYHSTPNCSTLKRSSGIQSGRMSQSGKGRACKVCN